MELQGPCDCQYGALDLLHVVKGSCRFNCVYLKAFFGSKTVTSWCRRVVSYSCTKRSSQCVQYLLSVTLTIRFCRLHNVKAARVGLAAARNADVDASWFGCRYG